ncbi:hypothetical protein PTI98_011569 [Pleurotus ostreatus]|nr:hypothetical protein PTI98_011569 [Pleurotus ostreatus]
MDIIVRKEGGMIAWHCALAVSVVVLGWWKPWKIGRRDRKLPPGPPTSFLLGNALQFPRLFPHHRFTEWAKEYGDIFSLKIFNETIVVLSSAEALRAILDKQGAVTGNRPKSHIIERTEGIYTVFGNMESHSWKSSRKAAHMLLTPDALKAHLHTQRPEWAQFLTDLLDSPDDLFTHIRRTSASIMTTIIYGRRCPEYANSPAERFFQGTHLLNKVVDAFTHPPIDLIPALQYVPTRWAKWKQLSNQTKAIRNALFTELLEECEARLASGRGLTGCFIENVIENKVELDMDRDEIKASGKVLMDGGTETTASLLQTFILAMINFPAVQKRAQEEIDRIIGGERVPNLDDFDKLPYLKAVIKEVHGYTLRPFLDNSHRVALLPLKPGTSLSAFVSAWDAPCHHPGRRLQGVCDPTRNHYIHQSMYVAEVRFILLDSPLLLTGGMHRDPRKFVRFSFFIAVSIRHHSRQS